MHTDRRPRTARPDSHSPGQSVDRLSLDARIVIMLGVDAGLSHAEIGRRIGRDRTIIWREVRRNRNPDGDYHARMAHARAAQKAHRPKAQARRKSRVRQYRSVDGRRVEPEADRRRCWHVITPMTGFPG